MSCDKEKCERTNKKVICLPDRRDSGKSCKIVKNVDLPNICLPGKSKVFDQKSIHVEQQSLFLVVKEGCHNKGGDEAHVNVHFKDGKIEGGKFSVLVKKPEVHVQPQKVHVEIVEGPKGTCDDMKVHVHVDCPKFDIKDPELEVKFEKHCGKYKAPQPIVCTKFVKHKHCGDGKRSTPQVTASYRKPSKKV